MAATASANLGSTNMTFMTEDQIECRVERMIDAADRRYMSGELTKTAYERRMREISEWADAQYSRAQALNRAHLRRMIPEDATAIPKRDRTAARRMRSAGKAP